jgi:hypothetical protein
LAVGFRQTNVIWVMFMAVQAIGPNLMQIIYTKLHENQQVTTLLVFTCSTVYKINDFSDPK